MGVIFIAGVYGVGKSTICEKLSLDTLIPHYSSSDLITNAVGEVYGRNKSVTDIDNNQKNLIHQVENLLKVNTQILLSGHFTIFDENCNVIRLETNVFERLNIDSIVLLENKADVIVNNLNKRDDKIYDIQHITNLIISEEDMCVEISQLLKLPMIKYQLTYSNIDLVNLKNMIIGD